MCGLSRKKNNVGDTVGFSVTTNCSSLVGLDWFIFESLWGFSREILEALVLLSIGGNNFLVGFPDLLLASLYS